MTEQRQGGQPAVQEQRGMGPWWQLGLGSILRPLQFLLSSGLAGAEAA